MCAKVYSTMSCTCMNDCEEITIAELNSNIREDYLQHKNLLKDYSKTFGLITAGLLFNCMILLPVCLLKN